MFLFLQVGLKSDGLPGIGDQKGLRGLVLLGLLTLVSAYFVYIISAKALVFILTQFLGCFDQAGESWHLQIQK